MPHRRKNYQLLLIFLIFCYQFPIQANGEEDPSFRFLDETCGELPVNFDGTAQSTAGIFVKRNKNRDNDLRNLEFLHTGTIVYSNVIITVLRTTSDQSRFIDENGKMLPTIWVGTQINETDNDGHTRAQFREVDSVVPYFNSPAKLNYTIVLLHLSEPFDLGSPMSKSICLPLTSTFPSLIKDPPDLASRYIKCKGYAKKYDGALEHHLHPIRFVQLMLPNDLMDCEKHFSANHNIGSFKGLHCGQGLTDANSGVCASLGSADALIHEGRLYLNGLAVLIPGKTCTRHDVFFFFSLLTSNVELQSWMSNSIKCLSQNKFSCPSGECINLKNICNKKSDCRDGSGLDEHSSLCEIFSNDPPTKGSVQISSRRQSNAQAQKQTNQVAVITDNIGTIKICPILQYSPGVVTRCTKDGRHIDCNKAQMGTVLELYCKPYYIANTKISRHTMTCKEDGTWDHFKSISCKADCGRINSNVGVQQKPFISGGAQVTKQFGFPWYAALFIWSKGSNKFEFSCGASLIENSVVVTAAHCVDSRKIRSDYNGFRIVLAPTSSVFVDNTENFGAKILKVNTVWLPHTFDSLTLTSDIALIQLSETVEYTENIRPVCYLTDNEAQTPTAGSVGLIAGFGKDDSNRISERLKFASFSVNSKTECEEPLRIHNWGAEFCAGSSNGTTACEGDSGGGLVFKRFNSESESSYVLKGIVSRGLTGPTGECVSRGATAFTHLDAFGAWILDTLMSNDII